MANKERVDIKRSDQFQEMDEALTEAMAALDSTLDKISAILQSGHEIEENVPAGEGESKGPGLAIEEDAPAATAPPARRADNDPQTD